MMHPASRWISRSILVVFVVLVVALSAGAHYVGLIYYPPTLGDDGTLYVGGSDGVLYALDPDGVSRFTHDVSAEITGPTVVAGGRILVATADGRVVAVESDGTEDWETRIGTGNDGARVRFLVAGTKSVYAVAGGTVYALSPRNGSKRWSFAVDGRILARPAFADGRLYVAGAVRESSTVYALSADGAPGWKRTYDGRVDALIAGPDGAVYFEADGRLYALSETGHERWELEVGDVWRPPAVSGDRLAAATFDGRIVVVRNGTIERIHRLDAPAAPAFGPRGERIYAVTPEAVLAFAGEERLFRTRIGATVVTAPTVDEEHVYVGTQLNRTYALSPNGSIAWIDRYATAFDSHGDADAPAFLADAAGTPTRIVHADPSGQEAEPRTEGGSDVELPGFGVLLGLAALVIALLVAGYRSQ